MSHRRGHPKSRRERLDLRTRLGSKITSTRDKVAKRVNKRGTKAKKDKATRWKNWKPITD